MLRAIIYILAIVTANIVTAKFMPLHLWIFFIPMGTFFIGATFILRDLVQSQLGRKKTYVVIIVALAISMIVSVFLGDMYWIVLASGISFLLSETTDTEIYSRLKLPFAYRVLYSGIVGGIIDSSVFVIIGLSPIGIGAVPWEAVPMAILGQIIVKTILQFFGASIIMYVHKKRK